MLHLLHACAYESTLKVAYILHLSALSYHFCTAAALRLRHYEIGIGKASPIHGVQNPTSAAQTQQLTNSPKTARRQIELARSEHIFIKECQKKMESLSKQAVKENNPILKVIADSIIDKFNMPDKYR